MAGRGCTCTGSQTLCPQCQYYAEYRQGFGTTRASNGPTAIVVPTPSPSAKPHRSTADYAPYASRTEQRFALHLTHLQRCGLIGQWWYEPVKLRLADHACFYTPDFCAIVHDDPRPILYEVKGYWREDARVKIKVAAALYGRLYRFVAVQWIKTQWREESF